MGRGHWNVGCREGFYSPLNWVLVWKRGNREGERKGGENPGYATNVNRRLNGTLIALFVITISNGSNLSIYAVLHR